MVAGRAAVVIEIAGPIVTENWACAVAPAASVTVAVKLTVADVVPMGTPVKTPEDSSVKPEPFRPVAPQVSGAVPPVALKFWV